MLSCFSHVWLCMTIWTAASQALLSMGILQARKEYWNGLPSPPPGDLPGPLYKNNSLIETQLYNIKFTISSCVFSGFGIFYIVQSSPNPILGNFRHSDPKGHMQLRIPVLLPSPRHPRIYFASLRTGHSGRFIEVESRTVWPFVSGLFHWAECLNVYLHCGVYRTLLPGLLHCRQILHCLSHQGSPLLLFMVA